MAAPHIVRVSKARRSVTPIPSATDGPPLIASMNRTNPTIESMTLVRVSADAHRAVALPLSDIARTSIPIHWAAA